MAEQSSNIKAKILQYRNNISRWRQVLDQQPQHQPNGPVDRSRLIEHFPGYVNAFEQVVRELEQERDRADREHNRADRERERADTECRRADCADSKALELTQKYKESREDLDQITGHVRQINAVTRKAATRSALKFSKPAMSTMPQATSSDPKTSHLVPSAAREALFSRSPLTAPRQGHTTASGPGTDTSVKLPDLPREIIEQIIKHYLHSTLEQLYFKNKFDAMIDFQQLSTLPTAARFKMLKEVELDMLGIDLVPIWRQLKAIAEIKTFKRLVSAAVLVSGDHIRFFTEHANNEDFENQVCLSLREKSPFQVPDRIREYLLVHLTNRALEVLEKVWRVANPSIREEVFGKCLNPNPLETVRTGYERWI